MNDTVLLFSSTMSNKHERILQLKTHINQLLLELNSIEPNENPIQLFNLSNEQCLFTCPCPYVSSHPMILHSTTYHDYKKFQQQQRKKPSIMTPKKNLLTFTCTTSTPKNSPRDKYLPQKFHLTSTPRRTKRQSINPIPLKRLLYNQDSHRTKKTILPRIPLETDHHSQWI